MKTIHRRLRRVESQFGLVKPRQVIRLVLSKAGWGLVLDRDRCLEILGECGFLSNEPIQVVKLIDIPEGFDAEELEKYLREHGADLCGPRKSVTAKPASGRR